MVARLSRSFVFLSSQDYISPDDFHSLSFYCTNGRKKIQKYIRKCFFIVDIQRYSWCAYSGKNVSRVCALCKQVTLATAGMREGWLKMTELFSIFFQVLTCVEEHLFEANRTFLYSSRVFGCFWTWWRLWRSLFHLFFDAFAFYFSHLSNIFWMGRARRTHRNNIESLFFAFTHHTDIENEEEREQK